jgi:hypothetical protein
MAPLSRRGRGAVCALCVCTVCVRVCVCVLLCFLCVHLLIGGYVCTCYYRALVRGQPASGGGSAINCSASCSSWARRPSACTTRAGGRSASSTSAARHSSARTRSSTRGGRGHWCAAAGRARSETRLRRALTPPPARPPAAAQNLTRALRCKDDKFVSFIAGCLRWVPEERFTPNQALRHPWIQARGCRTPRHTQRCRPARRRRARTDFRAARVWWRACRKQ